MNAPGPNVAQLQRPVSLELPLVASCPGQRIRNLLVRNKRGSRCTRGRCTGCGRRTPWYTAPRQEPGQSTERLSRIRAVTSLLQLRRTRQDPQIVEDVIVSHRKAAPNRALAIGAEDAAKQALSVVGRPGKPYFWSEVFLLRLGLPKDQDAGHRRDCIQFLILRAF